MAAIIAILISLGGFSVSLEETTIQLQKPQKTTEKIVVIDTSGM